MNLKKYCHYPVLHGNYREPGDLYRIIEFSGFIADLIYGDAAIESDTLNLPDVIAGQPVILFSQINDARPGSR